MLMHQVSFSLRLISRSVSIWSYRIYQFFFDSVLLSSSILYFSSTYIFSKLADQCLLGIWRSYRVIGVDGFLFWFFGSFSSFCIFLISILIRGHPNGSIYENDLFVNCFLGFFDFLRLQRPSKLFTIYY